MVRTVDSNKPQGRLVMKGFPGPGEAKTTLELREVFREAIARANKLVESQPEWKRNILAHSSSPTVTEPRPRVYNGDDSGW
jgi:hypothetical protein